MNWTNQLRDDSLSWLLEEENPGVRYLTLRNLMDCPDTDADFIQAQDKAQKDGPISQILNEMNEEG